MLPIYFFSITAGRKKRKERVIERMKKSGKAESNKKNFIFCRFR